MNEMGNKGSRELDQLMQINEELLRSKGKLLQEILGLKKQVAGNIKNVEEIGRLQAQLNAANTEIVNHLLNASVMSAEIEELKKKVAMLTHEKEVLDAEIKRLNEIKWYQRLLRKR